MDRDLVGYGKNPPHVEWPGQARIALSIVVNYEEGSELTPLYGDSEHETVADLVSRRPPEVRDLQNETQWEYGARVGVWRLLRILAEYEVKSTFFVSAMAFERNPEVAREVTAQGHQVSGHGFRWVEQWHLQPDEERDSIRRATEIIERTSGQRPLGWFTKNGPSLSTRQILQEEGYLYDCDGVNDDLPYYTQVKGRPWLVVPYALDSNDGKFWRGGWHDSSEFFGYLKDSFDLLYDEGRTHPKMLSVGLHSRVSGRPGRAVAVARFLEYARSKPGVWFCGRDDLARWWLEHYPPSSAQSGNRTSERAVAV